MDLDEIKIVIQRYHNSKVCSNNHKLIETKYKIVTKPPSTHTNWFQVDADESMQTLEKGESLQVCYIQHLA